jgi:hypothetical protein
MYGKKKLSNVDEVRLQMNINSKKEMTEYPASRRWMAVLSPHAQMYCFKR